MSGQSPTITIVVAHGEERHEFSFEDGDIVHWIRLPGQAPEVHYNTPACARQLAAALNAMAYLAERRA